MERLQRPILFVPGEKDSGDSEEDEADAGDLGETTKAGEGAEPEDDSLEPASEDEEGES